MYILSVATYGFEILALTKRNANKLKITKRAMGSVMLEVTLRNQTHSEDIRRSTKVMNIIKRVAKLK